MAQNEAALGINVLYIAYKEREHIITHSCQILKGLIFEYSNKFIQIMVLWSKWHCPGGHRVHEAVIIFSTLPHGTVGLYAVCACGISWPYFLFYIDLHTVKT